MPDETRPSPDADEVRESMKAAVERVRKQFAESLPFKPAEEANEVGETGDPR